MRKSEIQLIVDRVAIDRAELQLNGNARKLAHLAASIDETGVAGFMAVWHPDRRDRDPVKSGFI